MTGLGSFALDLVATSAEDSRSDAGPGIVAFVVVVALGVACWLLYRSLRSHLGRVRFDEGAPAQPRRRSGAWRPGDPWPASPEPTAPNVEPPPDR